MLNNMSEKVLNYIIYLQTECFKSNFIPCFQNHLNDIENVPSQDVRDIIIHLDELGYIKADIKHDYIGAVTLTHIGKSYFTEKEKLRKEKRNELIRWVITVAVALLNPIITAVTAILN